MDNCCKAVPILASSNELHKPQTLLYEDEDVSYTRDPRGEGHLPLAAVCVYQL